MLEEDEYVECSCCKEFKPTDDYYKSKKYSTGIRQPCKSCAKAKDKASRDKYIKQEKVIPEFKTCGTCGETKVAQDFTKRADTPTGLRSDCNDCILEKSKQYYNKNSEKVISRTSEYAHNHLEDVARWKRERRAADLDTHLAYERKYREDNKEYLREYTREYSKQPYVKEANKLAQIKYLSVPENLEKVKATSRKWRAANKDKVCYYSAKRRANVMQASPVWADQDIIKSFYAESRYFGLHVDHIIPLSHPLVCGLHCEYNLQLLSQKENSKKCNYFEVQEHIVPEFLDDE